MANFNLLHTLKFPQDLRKLNEEQQKNLCWEIRQRLIRTLSSTGGHLASNLGAVELTVALHTVFDLPQDQIVWDVGHQSYTHKLLTGRLKNAAFRDSRVRAKASMTHSSGDMQVHRFLRRMDLRRQKP